MSTFNHKKRRRFEGSHLIGVLLIASGVTAFVVSIFISLNPPFDNINPLIACLIIIGLVLVFTYSGIEINFTKSTFREYICFSGVKFGEWTSLPPISKVKLKFSNHTATNTPNGISPTLSGNVQEHRVLLYANQPTPLLSFTFNKREIGLRNAELLGLNLNTKVEVE